MNANRVGAGVLGIVTALPAACLVLYLAYFLPRLLSLGAQGGVSEDLYAKLFRASYDLLAAAAALGTVLLLGYCAYLIAGNRVPRDKKQTWLVILVVLNVLALPVFWYRFVWRGHGRAPAVGVPLS